MLKEFVDIEKKSKLEYNEAETEGIKLKEIQFGYTVAEMIFVDLLIGTPFAFAAWLKDGFQTWELIGIPIALILLAIILSRRVIVSEDGLEEKYIGFTVRRIPWSRVSAVDLIGADKHTRSFVFSLDGIQGLDRSLWGWLDWKRDMMVHPLGIIKCEFDVKYQEEYRTIIEQFHEVFDYNEKWTWKPQ